MPCDGVVSRVLEVAGLAVHAASGEAIRLPELALGPGECAALFGPSGAGKSTLLAAMFGLVQRPGWSVAGRVLCQGHDVAALAPGARQDLLRGGLALLPQDAQAALDPLAAVGRQLVEATGRSLPDCVAMLERLGVHDAAAVASRRPHAISGGQAQRVWLAIALLRSPPLVVADEPTASLDDASYAQLTSLLRAGLAQGGALLVATHDARVVRDLSAVVYTRVGDAFVRESSPPPPWPRRLRGAVGTETVLAAAGLHHAFGGHRVLAGVDFAVARGEIVAIVGESGAGKTTLVRVLAGHLRPDAGTVVRPRRIQAVQCLCQDAYGSLTPGVPLRRLLAEAHAESFDLAQTAAAVELPVAVLERPREQMSGGERRRAALLRAIAVDPDVLLLDEPTASLDRATAIGVLATLLELQCNRALALLIVTHDREMAAAVADRVLLLQGGRLCPA